VASARELAGEHAGQDEDEAQALPGGEGLAERDGAEQRRDHRAQQDEK